MGATGVPEPGEVSRVPILTGPPGADEFGLALVLDGFGVLIEVRR